MPDAGFTAAERQFLDVLATAAANLAVEVTLHSLPGVHHGDKVQRHLRMFYYDIGHLWDEPPDALIVTGTEPTTSQLTAEPYWDELAQLIQWAATATITTMLSCLAAHAALLLFDGVERQRLPHKCSGVFPNSISRAHPALEGLSGQIPVPHSRHHDIPEHVVAAHGWATLLSSPEASWTLLVGKRGRCSFLLVQGHPEYATTNLLREYRRDVRRFLQGESEAYPLLPIGYLDPAGVQLLQGFQTLAVEERSGRRPTTDFPYDDVARGLVNGWKAPAERLFTNWLNETTRSRLGHRDPALVTRTCNTG